MAQARRPNGHGNAAGKKGHRSGPQENEVDLETEIEDEMLASGHHRVVPRTDVIGAHTARVVPSGPDLDEANRPPPGAGANVGPTARAAERERTRHDLEAKVGLHTAGNEGRLHQERPSTVTREALADAAARADQKVTSSAQTASGPRPATADERVAAAKEEARQANESKTLRELLWQLGGVLVSAGVVVGVRIVNAVKDRLHRRKSHA